VALLKVGEPSWAVFGGTPDRVPARRLIRTVMFGITMKPPGVKVPSYYIPKTPL